MQKDINLKLKNVISKLCNEFKDYEKLVKYLILASLTNENILIFSNFKAIKLYVLQILLSLFKNFSYFEHSFLNDKYSLIENKLSNKELEKTLSLVLKNEIVDSKCDFLTKTSFVYLDYITNENEDLLYQINKLNFTKYKEKLSLLSLICRIPTYKNDCYAKYLSDDTFFKIIDNNNLLFSNIKEISKKAKKILITEKTDDSDCYFTLNDILNIRLNSKNIYINSNIIKVLQKILCELGKIVGINNLEKLSGEKLKRIIDILKVSAYTNNRNEVDFSDLVLLKDFLWVYPHEIKIINNIIDTILNNSSYLQNYKTSISKILSFDNKGSGTKDDPYLIESIDDFLLLNEPNFNLPDMYFKQIKDIDFSDYEYKTIPKFYAHYDGNGYKIINLKLENTKDNSICALFESIEKNSSIKNLTLENIYIYSNDQNCSIVIKNNGEISNLNVNGIILASTFKPRTKLNLGGICCENYGKILNCNVSCIISSSSYNIDSDLMLGGICCENYGEILSCKTSNLILAYASDAGIYAGGIVSINKDNGKISNCEANDTILILSFVQSIVGGICSKNKNEIYHCISNCNISSITKSLTLDCKAGGIVGHCIMDSIIDSCFVEGIVSGFGSNKELSDNLGKITGNFVITQNKEFNIKILNTYYSIKLVDKHNRILKFLTNCKEIDKKNLFENILKFDFDNYWQWNENFNLPTLKFNNPESNHIQNSVSNFNLDNLVKKIKNNIWLSHEK